jgi:multidrug efflux pump subunit AcrB
MMSRGLGMAGRMAAAFLHSKLTPLFMLAATALGVFAVVMLPREEEPQIVVPMIDVFVELPGATPTEVEQRVTRPLEKLIWEIPGVEYVYSTSSPGRAMVIVRFLVGQDQERAIVRLNQKLAANADRIPPGASGPLVKPRSIDDVPIMSLALTSSRYDDHQLRLLAGQLHDALKEVPDVSEVTIIGGRPRVAAVDIDPARLSVYGVDPLMLRTAIARSDVQLSGTGPLQDGQLTVLDAGNRLRSVDDLRDVVITSRNGRPVRIGDVAQVSDRDASPTTYVRHYTSAGSTPAVVLAVSKRAGTNAIDIAHRVQAKVDTLRGSLIPSDVDVVVTRDYGETAAEKSNELLYHMALAVISVSILIWLALGRREAAVVLIAIPVTLALTLFMFYLYGYTLNRITLFALIFSIGILVDDAIVVVENIVRHARLESGGEGGLGAIAVRAVDEVGNPTILATLAVVAAILPMAFVGGLMGPYMRPIPIGASAAMMFSLVVAFLVTPWAAVRLLKPHGHGHDQGREDAMTRWYRVFMGSLIADRTRRWVFLAGVVVLLLGAMALVPLKLVTVKMLPFDNKSEFQVLVDMPEGTPLEQTARVTATLATAALEDPTVRHVQDFVGTSSPYNFNGLVRHYFLRQGPHVADLQVNLLPKHDRSDQSHAIARRMRERLLPIAQSFGATIQVAEVPPGPPVLQTLVAEVYGPDPAQREEIARKVRAIFEETPGVVDTDWYLEDPQTRLSLEVDAEKAAAAGIAPDVVASLVRMAGDGDSAGLLHDDVAREDVPIVIRLPREARQRLDAFQALRLGGQQSVSIGELTRLRSRTEDVSLYHKNLQPVTYVTGDLAGEDESPVYAIMRMNEALAGLTLPNGHAIEIFNAVQPTDSTRPALKWDGEWHVTIEVFRDLGLAFAAVLILIYVLVVGWFESFETPLLIMIAIPFSLVGILPAHALMGAFFTATSMIGFIAGAGIVVRNSIILVDFIELRLSEGMPLELAVVDAGAVRFRPMALTAAAVIVGAGVILFDPIFQGLAISLMAGEVASLALSRMAVPVLYYMAKHRREVAPEAEPVAVG